MYHKEKINLSGRGAHHIYLESEVDILIFATRRASATLKT